MKNIFTYPDNAATNYVDPDYDGADTTEGLKRRLNELKNGTYLDWHGTAPPGTLDEFTQGIAKYVNYIDYYGEGNLKIFDMWSEDIVEFPVRDAGYRVSEIYTRLDSTINQGVICLKFDGDAQHDLEDGDSLDFRQMTDDQDDNGNDRDLSELNFPHPYAKVFTARNDTALYQEDTLSNAWEVAGIFQNRKQWHAISHNGGTRVFFDDATDVSYTSGNGVWVAEQMSSVTGTANPVGDTKLYLDKISNDIYDVYTDSGLTTDATITNETNFSATYEKLFNVNFSSTNLAVYDVSTTAGSGIAGFVQNIYASGGVCDSYPTSVQPNPGDTKYWGIARLKKRTTGSAALVEAVGTKTIPTSIDDSEFYFWIYTVDEDELRFYNDWDADNHRPDYTTPVQFGVGGAVPGTDEAFIEMAFVVMGNQKAKNKGGSGIWYDQWTVSNITNGRCGLNPILNVTGEDPLYVIDRDTGPTVYNFGNRTFKQRTGESTYQFAADIDTGWWLPGGTEKQTPAIDEYNQNPDTTGLNGSGLFTGTSIFSPFGTFSIYLNAMAWALSVLFNGEDGYYFTSLGTGFSYPNEAAKGKFRVNSPRVWRLIPKPDTYTPPALSTEAQQDVWDDGSEWDNKEFSLAKTFPSTVAPKTINWRIIAPSTKSQSQSGIKFTRSAGYIKYGFDVEYPPMTAEEFEEYNGFINAIRGQDHPFYFKINQNGTNMIGARTISQSHQALRMKERSNAGTQHIMIEGFLGNEENAVREGELFILGTSPHGNLYTATTTTDANAYGEAKFRIATPLRQTLGHAFPVFHKPYHIVVSMDSDSIEVTRDSAGFYYLSFSATADGWE